MADGYDRFDNEGGGGGSFVMGLLTGTVLGAGLGMLSILFVLPALESVGGATLAAAIQHAAEDGIVVMFGNSTGDEQMLEYTGAGDGARLMMLVHHDDAEREYAYGAESKIGTFSDALMGEAKKKGWIVISMKDDWQTIFPPTGAKQ